MNIIENVETHWTIKASRLLQNRKIKRVRYMSNEEAAHFGWYSRPIVIELDNGVLLWPSRDDEGNDGGSLFTTSQTCDTLPVLRAEEVDA